MKFVTLIVLSFGVLFLAGCGWQQSSKNQPITSTPVTQRADINQFTQQSSDLVTTIPTDWQIYKNDKYNFNIAYPSTWLLENNYKSASEKSDVGIVGMDNEFITLTSPTNNYINIGVTKKGGSVSDTGDISTGRELYNFVNVGNIKIGDQSSQFSFILGQNNNISSGTMKPIDLGNYEIHAFLFFANDQKLDLVEKNSDFQIAIKIIESFSFTKTGFIEGSLGYPSEFIPKEMKVCAENINTKEQYCTAIHLYSDKYTYGEGYHLEVPVGDYYVFASFWKNYRAYYSEFVTCGLENKCKSHKPIIVNVLSEKTIGNVDPQDWYQ